MNFVISRSKLNTCSGNFQRSVQLKKISRKKDKFSSKRTFPDKRFDRQVNELAQSEKKNTSLYQHVSVADRSFFSYIDCNLRHATEMSSIDRVVTSSLLDCVSHSVQRRLLGRSFTAISRFFVSFIGHQSNHHLQEIVMTFLSETSGH